MAVAEEPHLAQERRRRLDVAALALDRLDHHARHLGRRDLGRQDGVETGEGGLGREVLVAPELVVGVRVGRQVDARQDRLVAGPVVER